MKHVLFLVVYTSEIDVYDLDKHTVGIPHDEYSRLRKECPVYFNKEPDGRGFWAITKYEDIVRISKDPKTFSSHVGGTNIPDYPPENLTTIQLLMINLDPPKHNQFRRIVRRGFTPRMVKVLETYTRQAATKIVDEIAKKGECEFVTSVAAELPLVILCDLMGVPLEDRHNIFDWSNRLIGFDDPEFQTCIEDAMQAAFELCTYAQSLSDNRASIRKDSLVNLMLDAEIDGEKLTDMEFNFFILMLSVTGNETTRNAISSGTLTLMQHPEAKQRLIDDPSLIPSAVDEMLRWDSPLIHFRRTATCDVEIGGQKIKKNDKLAMFYLSANRDEDAFENPDVFDITRSPNDHLAFGVGQHFCLGANLAKLELRIMFEELLKRLPDIELNGEVRRLRSNFINGYKTIPVKFTPEPCRSRE